MKKLVLAMTLFCALLLPCFSQKMTEEEIFKDYIPDIRKDYISDLKVLKNIYLNMECYIIVITEKESISFYLGFIQNKKVKFYKLFGASYLNFRENKMFPYSNSILSF